MNILFTKFPLQSHYGGGEKHTLQLAEGLITRGHTCYFLGSDPILTQEWAKRSWPVTKISVGLEPTSKLGLLVFTLRLPLTFLQFGYLAWRFRTEQKIEVVYAQSLTEKLLMTPWLLWSGVRVYWMEHLQIEKWLLKNPYKGLYRHLAKRAVVITVSQGVGDQLLDLGLARSQVKVIYNGIDIEDFQPDVDKKPTKPLVIGTVARLAIEKDIATVIKAIALLPDPTAVSYKIAGTGDQRASLKALARELNVEKQVALLGFRQDVKQFLSELDVFVLTSFRRESFGIAVAEAMAMGKPAIVTDIVGLREVVKDKETGFVVPPKSEKSVSQALAYFIAHPEKILAMGQAARERVVHNFCLERMIDSFEKLFAGRQ